MKEYYTRVFVLEGNLEAFLTKCPLSWRYVGKTPDYCETSHGFGTRDLYEFEYIDYTRVAHTATINFAKKAPIQSLGVFCRDISINNPLLYE